MPKGKTYMPKIKDGLLRTGIQMFAGGPTRTIKAAFPWGLGGEVRKAQTAFWIIPVAWAHEEVARWKDLS